MAPVWGMRMARFSAGEAAFTGFRVVRAHPKAAVVWGGVHLAIQVVFAALIAATIGPALMQLQAMGPAAKRDPAQTAALLGHMAPVYLILGVFFLVFYPVLIAAMNRVVLRPSEGRFAYLRLGRDELRMLGLLLMFIGLAIGAEVAAAIIGVIIEVVLTLVFKAQARMAILPLVAAFLCAWVFVSVRLSLAFSQTFATGRISLFRSWSTTSGQFWPMLGAYVLALVFVVILYIVAYLAMFVLTLVTGGGVGGLMAIFRPDLTVTAILSPVRLIHLVMSAVLLTVVWPLLITPQAAIYAALGGAGAVRQLDVSQAPLSSSGPWR